MMHVRVYGLTKAGSQIPQAGRVNPMTVPAGRVLSNLSSGFFIFERQTVIIGMYTKFSAKI
jgi:hypothetical protein